MRYEKMAITIPTIAQMMALVAFFMTASSPRHVMSLIPLITNETIQTTPTAIQRYSLMVLMIDITSPELLEISDWPFVACWISWYPSVLGRETWRSTAHTNEKRESDEQRARMSKEIFFIWYYKLIEDLVIDCMRLTIASAERATIIPTAIFTKLSMAFFSFALSHCARTYVTPT